MKTTRLQAINKMLAAVGEAPVVSADINIPEVISAQAMLDEVTREVLARSWHFNTDTDYPLAPAADGTIAIPADASRVDATDTRADIVERNGKLYNKDTHSFVFTESVKADITWSWPFEQLPEPARQYIAIRAARRYQREQLGSVSTDKLTDDDERTAYLQLVEFDAASGDYNLLTNNPDSRDFR